MHSISEVALNNALLMGETAFNEIVQLYSGKLLAIAVYVTKDPQTAEDIVQEAFLKVWEKRIDIIPETVGSWLCTVTYNLAFKHLRRESLKAQIYTSLRNNSNEFYSQVEERLLQKEKKWFLDKTFNRLPPQQQLVYKMSCREGLSRNEIADVLNISPNTVKNHLTRAVQFIKENVVAFSLLMIFFVFNNIFFKNGSTTPDLKDIYKVKPAANKKIGQAISDPSAGGAFISLADRR